MTNLLAPVPKAKFFDNNGRPAVGYKVFTYAAGTNTKIDSYPDAGTVTPNSNPIELNFRGEANIWIPPNVAYKIVFTTPDDTDPPSAPIWTVDDIVDSQLVTLWGGTDTGAANAYVLDFVANFTSYTDGIVIYWLPSNTNTGASTINVNGLGPVAITNQDGSALTAGQIQAGQIAQILYLGTGFVVLTALTVITTGTFQATFDVGFTVPLVVNINFTRFGNSVTLFAGSGGLTGTSNSSAFQATSGVIPVGLRPNGNRSMPCGSLVNNSVTDRFGNLFINSNGNMQFGLFTGTVFDPSGFTAAGLKGLFTGWQVSYTL